MQKQNLPVLMTRMEHIIDGQPLEELKPALDLIMLTIRSFPDIQILAIENPTDHKHLRFHMRYRGKKICTVNMPIRSDMPSLLNALQSAILSMDKQKNSRYFDLSYEGSVVVK